MTRKLRNFIKGMGSVFDLTGASVQRHISVGEGVVRTDTCMESLQGDWQKLSQDFASAFNESAPRNSHVKAK